MSNTERPSFPPDPISEGAHARSLGRPKDACPYPAGTEERKSWLEGYDGAPADEAGVSPATNG
ncbi:ribosome modulation factor [Methylobacterium gnaphalii]|uniref:Ribosome modulation factor n=1 Tax=Methylobacterium gnaphalii TaxID=1010610 RepID=A0A512JRQ9_9HYPH|nr:Rmf/CrpP family protein [Methylobacterium gnaphalii]GEP12635.1 hypothetical protein MGN01_44800 [Methylobacterium gnaphalii]GJD71780.1 hypothetical protein MMMDOFMJ_4745 [Methylobacterium gnaphalii]GLS48931.1 hypothetical protein GCM10007885_17780 [Methylobacterium gnaphalii]